MSSDLDWLLVQEDGFISTDTADLWIMLYIIIYYAFLFSFVHS